jgi:hypothetical protein
MRVMLVSVCLATSHAIAQGTLTFWNAPTATLTPEGAPVTDIDGATRLAGAGFFAQLYASPVNDEGSLFPIGVPVPFRTGLAAGFVVSSQVAVPGSPAVTYAFVQMRAWENLGGSAATYEAALASGLKSGKSNIIQVGPLGGICFGCPIIDPTLVGLQPFSLVPEPSITMLSLLGGLVIGAIGLVRKKPSLMVNPDEDMVLGKRTVSKVGDHNVA